MTPNTNTKISLFTGHENDIVKLLDKVDELIYQYQFFPDTKKHRFPFVTKAIENLFELKPEEIRDNGTPALMRVHIDDRQLFQTTVRESKRKLERWDYSFRVILPQKGLKWLKGYGIPERLSDGSILWVGTITDITEKKNLESDLLENRERLRLAIKSSRDGIWDWDVKSNKTFYSKASLDMLGFHESELVAHADAWSKRVHPDDLKAYYEDIEKHFKGETEYYVNEHRVKHRDGHYIWILDRGKLIARDKAGNPTRVIGTHSDITEIKKSQQEAIKMLNVASEQNNRLTNFAHIVSHNLKSHASNFESLFTLLEATEDIDEKFEIVGYLKKVSDGLIETISHLSEVITVQTNIKSELQELNLYNYIEKSCNILRGDINQYEATINNRVPQEVTVHYNPAYLESALLNLLTNALKYRREDTKLIVDLELFKKKDQYILTISDNGKGLDLDKFGDRLFGMYNTFHGNADAKGIGLFITKNQIEAMGGTISVTGGKNQGLTFKIVFDESDHLQ